MIGNGVWPDRMSTSQAPLLDTLRQYEIPEGVSLEFRLAGPVVRACAWGIDTALRGLLYLALLFLFSFFGGLGIAAMLISIFLIEWFYPVIFELLNGATPGKRAMGIWVIQDNGTPLTPAASIIRNLLRTADFLPLLYGFGLVSMLVNREFKRLGDLAAGTLVVYRDRPSERMSPPSERVVSPPMELNEAERRAVLAFAERAERLSSSRRIELAEMLSGVTGRRGQQAVENLYGYANWIIKGHSRASSARGICTSPHGSR
ncbi:MAG: RDD family protein [Pseudomonadota bacterium]